jgi:hypothetical protein
MPDEEEKDSPRMNADVAQNQKKLLLMPAIEEAYFEDTPIK